MFITRFVKAQNPPPDVAPPGVGQTQLMVWNTFMLELLIFDVVLFQERLARFVSLIPFLPDAIVFSENCNIWTTSDVRKLIYMHC